MCNLFHTFEVATWYSSILQENGCHGWADSNWSSLRAAMELADTTYLTQSSMSCVYACYFVSSTVYSIHISSMAANVILSQNIWLFFFEDSTFKNWNHIECMFLFVSLIPLSSNSIPIVTNRIFCWLPTPMCVWVCVCVCDLHTINRQFSIFWLLSVTAMSKGVPTPFQGDIIPLAHIPECKSVDLYAQIHTVAHNHPQG